MLKNETINKAEFYELCKYVCCQLIPSGSRELDRETLNFAIYWQVCHIFDEQVLFKDNSRSKITVYQRQLQDLLNVRVTDPFDILQIVDMNINESVSKHYENQPVFVYDKFDYPINLPVNKTTV